MGHKMVAEYLSIFVAQKGRERDYPVVEVDDATANKEQNCASARTPNFQTKTPALTYLRCRCTSWINHHRHRVHPNLWPGLLPAAAESA